MTSLNSTRFPSTRRRNARRLGFDPLESRALLTAGVLDPTFGTVGIVTSPEPIGGNSGDGAPNAATALYPQTDAGDPADAGKIVVVGTYNTGSKDDFAVLRYNPNGSLDTSFGGTGEVITSLTAYGDDAHAVAIQPNGKIIVGGFGGTSGYPTFNTVPALARYNANGTLDTSFGVGGLVTTQFKSSKGSQTFGDVWSIVLESNGEILAGGNGGLALYKANGTVDTSFGNGGVVTTQSTLGGLNVLRDVGLQTVNGNSDIVAVGEGSAGASAIRYNLNGSLDTSFGTKGIATFANLSVTSGAIQPDGSIIAAGSVAGAVTINGNLYGTSHMSLVRFTPSGGLDTSFGTGGEVQTAFVSGRDTSAANSVVVQPDGAIVAGGYAPAYAGSPGAWAPLEPALARYTPTGQLDTTFGAAGTGLVVTPVDSTSPGNGRITGLALQADGGIVTTGYAEFGTSYDFLTARYLGDPSQPPASPMLTRQGSPTNNIPAPAFVPAASTVATPSSALVPLVLEDPSFLDSLVKDKKRQA